MPFGEPSTGCEAEPCGAAGDALGPEGDHQSCGSGSAGVDERRWPQAFAPPSSKVYEHLSVPMHPIATCRTLLGMGSDAELWGQAQTGDSWAFGMIFDRHRDRIFHHCLRHIQSIEDAEDVTAMVFLEAWRRRSDVRITGGSVAPWLLLTANNVMRNHVRARRRYQKLLDKIPRQEVSDHSEDVLDDVERQARARHIRVAFAGLNVREQDILTLCVFQGLSTSQAGVALGIPHGTAKSRLLRAKDKFAALLPPEISPRSIVEGKVS